MIAITLQGADRIEWALKAFRRQVLQSGLFQ
jgi:ribosomal protein S21